MTTTVSAIDGGQLSDIRGCYLAKIGEAELRENSEAAGADEMPCEV